MSKGVNPAHVNSVVRQNADLIAKNKRLVEQIATMRAAMSHPNDGNTARVASSPDEAKARLKKSLHDAYAFAVEAIDEMAAAGATLSPLAKLFTALAAESMPAGYRATWRAKDLPFKREAANAMSSD